MDAPKVLVGKTISIHPNRQETDPHKINYTQNRLIVLSTSIYRVAELLHNQNVNVIGKQTAKTMLVSHVLKSGDAVDAVGIIVEVVHSVASKSR